MSALNLTLQAQLSSGPATVSDGTFPPGVTQVQLQLNPSTRQVNVDTGAMVANVNSPSAYVTLPGIGGAVGPVTQGLFLYLRTVAPVAVRLTMFGASGNTTSVLLTNGLLVLEFDPLHYLTLLEIQGTGTVEYYAAGLT